MWLSRALAFYKIAVDQQETLEEEYRRELTALKSTANRDKYVAFIKKWQDTTFFDLDEIMPFILEDAATMSFSSMMVWWDLEPPNSYRPEVLKQIMDALVNLYSGEETYNFYDYMDAEKYKDLLSPETFKKAQRAIILYLINVINRAGREDADDKDRLDAEWSIQKLFDQSKYLPKSLIRTLTKRLGPEFYAQTFRNRSTIKSVLEKPQLTEYDIEELFYHFGSSTFEGFSREDFLKIINKSTPAAKEYLRRFLYRGAKYSYTDFFMLSDDMTPMNVDYQTVELPPIIRILRLRQIPSPVPGGPIDRWHKVFEEFHIIPA